MLSLLLSLLSLLSLLLCRFPSEAATFAALSCYQVSHGVYVVVFITLCAVHQVTFRPPMNSIPVVHHLECNVVPLKILISLEFIHALIDFFDPEALRAKKDEEVRK